MQRDLVFSEALDLAPPVQKPALKAPWHLFLIGAAALLWSLLGVFDFLATATRFPPYIAQFPEGAEAYWAMFPAWLYAVWGVGVFSSLVGSVLLLKRQALALRVFALSATATVLTTAVSYSRAAPDFDGNRAFAVCIIVVSLLILNYTLHQTKRGVLR